MSTAASWVSWLVGGIGVAVGAAAIYLAIRVRMPQKQPPPRPTPDREAVIGMEQREAARLRATTAARHAEVAHVAATADADLRSDRLAELIQ